MFVSDLCSLIVLAPRSRNPECFRDWTYDPALVMTAQQLNKQKRKIRAALRCAMQGSNLRIVAHRNLPGAPTTPRSPSAKPC